MSEINMKVRTIPEAIKKKWVAALRSGNYRPGTGWLKRGNSFCCLGVLCDISKLGGWQGDKYVVDTPKQTHTMFLTPTGPFQEWLDWDEPWFNPPIRYKSKIGFLSELNDKKHLTFGEIADIIEEQL